MVSPGFCPYHFRYNGQQPGALPTHGLAGRTMSQRSTVSADSRDDASDDGAALAEERERQRNFGLCVVYCCGKTLPSPGVQVSAQVTEWARHITVASCPDGRRPLGCPCVESVMFIYQGCSRERFAITITIVVQLFGATPSSIERSLWFDTAS